MNLKLVSEDNRRKLYEFGEGNNWKIAKYIEVTEDSVIGNHLHKNKDELFLVVKGEVTYELRWDEMVLKLTVNYPQTIYVPRNTFHIFNCKAGTIIIGLATELHDDNDDIKL